MRVANVFAPSIVCVCMFDRACLHDQQNTSARSIEHVCMVQTNTFRQSECIRLSVYERVPANTFAALHNEVNVFAQGNKVKHVWAPTCMYQPTELLTWPTHNCTQKPTSCRGKIILRYRPWRHRRKIFGKNAFYAPWGAVQILYVCWTRLEWNTFVFVVAVLWSRPCQRSLSRTQRSYMRKYAENTRSYSMLTCI